MTFIEYILKAMEKQEITAYKLCKDIGLSQQTFSNWKAGKTPALDTAMKIVIYLGLSADEIFGIKPTQVQLTENETELLKAFQKLPDREQIKEIGKMEEKAERYSNQQEQLSTSRTG